MMPRYPMTGAQWNARQKIRKKRIKRVKRKSILKKLKFWK
jgi:hypothetical protein